MTQSKQQRGPSLGNACPNNSNKEALSSQRSRLCLIYISDRPRPTINILSICGRPSARMCHSSTDQGSMVQPRLAYAAVTNSPIGAGEKKHLHHVSQMLCRPFRTRFLTRYNGSTYVVIQRNQNTWNSTICSVMDSGLGSYT